jgi:hypothetical protein
VSSGFGVVVNWSLKKYPGQPEVESPTYFTPRFTVILCCKLILIAITSTVDEQFTIA